MDKLLENLELVRREIEERKVCLKELSESLKIPKTTLKNTLYDEEFFQRNIPYSIYTLKKVAKKLNLDLDFKNHKKSIEPALETNSSKEEKPSFKERLIPAFRILGLSIFTAVFLFLSYFYTEKNDISITDYSYKQALTLKNEDKTLSSGKLTLLAKKDIWITADIDGEKQVISLKKGQKKQITFSSKIHFETIGNADQLTILYNGEKISFSKKVVHNIFVDSEGVFKDGYNLYKGKSS